MKPLYLIVAALTASLLSGPAEAQLSKPAKAPQKKSEAGKKPATKKDSKLPFKSLNENVSYAVGLNFAKRLVSNLKRQGLTIDVEKLGTAIKISDATVADMKRQGLEVVRKQLDQGFGAGITGKKPLMTDQQIATVFQEVQKQLMAKAAERRKEEMKRLKELADKNKRQGQLFLAKNAKKKGIVTTKSGLQYEIIKEGKGKSPTKSDVVVTHYRGTLLDGTEFDSSVKRGQPATFPVNGVIQGWTEALQLMKVGSKWKLYVPSNLAYGPNGSRSGTIGPNATLVFEVELIEVKEQPKPKTKSLPKRKP